MRGRDLSGDHDFNKYLRKAQRDWRALAKRCGPNKTLRRVSAETVVKNHRLLIREFHKEIRANLSREHDLPDLSPRMLTEIERSAANVVFCNHSLPASTGLVVAGYGDGELTPGWFKYEIDGFTPYGLRTVGPERNMIDSTNQCSVRAFAQAEMAEVFMEGIDRRYSGYLKRNLEVLFDGIPGIINKALGIKASSRRLSVLERELRRTLSDFEKKAVAFRKSNFTEKVLDAVRFLDKSELAAMAESLVSITALKRRFTLDTESVGGPIDLAVISKGDGFIWIKRKHYFDIELNRSFMERYLPPATTKGGLNERKTARRSRKTSRVKTRKARPSRSR